MFLFQRHYYVWDPKKPTGSNINRATLNVVVGHTTNATWRKLSQDVNKKMMFKSIFFITNNSNHFSVKLRRQTIFRNPLWIVLVNVWICLINILKQPMSLKLLYRLSDYFRPTWSLKEKMTNSQRYILPTKLSRSLSHGQMLEIKDTFLFHWKTLLTITQ